VKQVKFLWAEQTFSHPEITTGRVCHQNLNEKLKPNKNKKNTTPQKKH